MTRGFQRFTQRYVNVLGVLIGLVVVSSILLYAGCGMVSSPPNTPATPTPTPDTVRPTSIITSPTAGGIVSTSATVNITGTASDAGGGTVQSVQVSVDGGLTWNLAMGTSAWSYAWSPTLSGHATIKSRAIDTSGNQQNPPAEVTVTVQDGTPPTSKITSPTSGTTVIAGTTFTITGTGSDTGGGSVQSIEVSVDGGATWNPAIGTNAWAYFWFPTVVGPATIKSRATDTWGNRQDPPAEVTVTVQERPRPTSTITSPTAGATVLTTTTTIITGTASHPSGGTVQVVEVSVDGGATWSLATGTNSWSYFWSPILAGPATIKSRAIDTTGSRQDPPTEVTVTVQDPRPPTVSPRIPEAGETDVGTLNVVSAFFSEPMDPATVNESTVEILDPSSAPVPAVVNYSEINRIVFLDPTEPLLTGTTYTVRVKGGDTDPRVKDLAGNALAADATWTFTTGVAPQVISTTPANGATDVLIGVAPRVKFSKKTSISLFASAVLLQDSAGNRVPFDVSFPSSDFTVAILPQGLLQPMQTYKVTLKGGPNEPHITDDRGTPLESDYTWSFTTGAAPPPIPTFSVFLPTVTPANPVSDNSMATEVGMKFRSDIDGFITGARYYKGGVTSGLGHVAHLWASDGTRLASGSFFRESESGWQQARFQTPAPITANTTYVVSYFAHQGRYAEDLGYFASTGVDNSPLHALQDGVAGGNGVRLLTPTGGFPTETFMSANYYVDAIFTPLVSPPQVLSTLPAPGSSLNLPPSGQPATVTVTFTEAVDPTTVNESTVLLTDTANNPIPVTISFGTDNFRAIITPQQRPQIGPAYTVILKGGPGEPHITNATGTPLVADYTWSFTADLSLRPAFTEEPMISNRVTSGVNFIALRPDNRVARLLGLNYTPPILSRLLKPAM